MSTLEDLEKEFNFTYPELYKQLYADRMLDWGSDGNGWYTNVFPMLKENPPLLLFGSDIEIWDPIVYRDGIREMVNHEVYDINPKYQMVPLAKNGAGDLYVFQLDMENNGEVPITFFGHDSDAEILAKNLQDFIFRQLLESLTEIDEYSMFYEDSEEKIKQNLHNQLKTHRKYLKAEQVEILEDIYQLDIFEYTYKIPNGGEFEAKGLLTFDELEKLIKQEMAFEKLNTKFDYWK
ncbi:cell wall assembly protein [Elizabethkingia miricola]|uniref:Cell wall assembly protein n=1 Tax=Elizabethkingia miricola TaxID=172045 RepID=A0ABD4DQN3_ELIMR|nr:MULTISPECIES: SMI1/KNR4 family protein [Elizabethkingia]KUY20825.1 cell wall assembly protein [Elizabethkingia miricola]MCL1652969.1 SMI1/KNR4 family protein [Elizabethkingia miricola]MCL1677760.1 SMI1/KNR4 family protein [Elizabethkingia miricola]OPC70645.1 cell wall assembly protein [Elizabethkingia miricola]OPC74654.1 cell wall assembly protein [Elizabethkingia miricola]